MFSQSFHYRQDRQERDERGCDVNTIRVDHAVVPVRAQPVVPPLYSGWLTDWLYRSPRQAQTHRPAVVISPLFWTRSYPLVGWLAKLGVVITNQLGKYRSWQVIRIKMNAVTKKDEIVDVWKLHPHLQAWRDAMNEVNWRSLPQNPSYFIIVSSVLPAHYLVNIQL